MRSASQSILALSLVGAILIGVLAAFIPTRERRHEEFLRSVRADFLSSRPALMQFLARLPSPQGQPGLLPFDSLVATPIGRRLLRVRRDGQGSVFLILRDSWVTYNVGIMAPARGPTPFSDGEERKITWTSSLGDGWFLYYAS